MIVPEPLLGSSCSLGIAFPFRLVVHVLQVGRCRGPLFHRGLRSVEIRHPSIRDRFIDDRAVGQDQLTASSSTSSSAKPSSLSAASLNSVDEEIDGGLDAGRDRPGPTSAERC